MNLIGISGKIGSGKDTVGAIIRDLYITNNNDLYEIKKFATKTKIIASLLTGIPVEKFEDQEFKKTILGREWSKVNEFDAFSNVSFLKMMSVRELLQKIGTDAMRNNVHEDTWVNALFADYSKDQKWIITDVRFPNEYNAIKKRSGIIIRINRPGYGTSMKELAEAHPSETALDGFDFDYIIENDDNLENLVKNVRKIIIQ